VQWLASSYPAQPLADGAFHLPAAVELFANGFKEFDTAGTDKAFLSFGAKIVHTKRVPCHKSAALRTDKKTAVVNRAGTRDLCPQQQVDQKQDRIVPFLYTGKTATARMTLSAGHTTSPNAFLLHAELGVADGSLISPEKNLHLPVFPQQVSVR